MNRIIFWQGLAALCLLGTILIGTASRANAAGANAATAAYITVQPNSGNTGYLFTYSWVAPDHDNTGTDDYNNTIYRNGVPGANGSELDDVTNVTGGRYSFDNTANGGGGDTEVRYRWGTNTGTVPPNDASAVGWQGTMDYTVDGTTAAPTRVTAIWDNLGAIQVGGSFQAYGSGVQGVTGYYTASPDGSGAQKAAGVIHDDGDGGRMGFMVEKSPDAYETYTGTSPAPSDHYYPSTTDPGSDGFGPSGNGTGVVGAPTTGFIQVDIPYPTNGVVSDPFTERFNPGVYTNNSVVELRITTDNTYTPKLAVAGDFDSDFDVDNTDLGVATANFSGATGALGSNGLRYLNGNVDADSDVDNADLGAIIGAITPSVPGGSTFADLIYDPVTGNVQIDASEANGAIVTSFQLENGAAGTFLPGSYNSLTGGGFGGLSEDLSATVLGDSDTTLAGFGGTADLGNVLPTGLDLASLGAYLSTALYTGQAGSGQQPFDLVLASAEAIPEPSTVTLAALGLLSLGFVGWRRRRR